MKMSYLTFSVLKLDIEDISLKTLFYHKPVKTIHGNVPGNKRNLFGDHGVIKITIFEKNEIQSFLPNGRITRCWAYRVFINSLTVVEYIRSYSIRVFI